MLKITDKLNKIPEYSESYDVIYKDYNVKVYFPKQNNENDKMLVEKQIEELKNSINRRKKLLSNENYIQKAPLQIVESERQKLKEEEETLNKLQN